MTTDGSISAYSESHNLPSDDPSYLVRPARFGALTESTVVRRMIDLAMVSLIGGGPRLAIRATRVFFEDSYASRSDARKLSRSTAHGCGDE
jgi:hypothetical protein